MAESGLSLGYSDIFSAVSRSALGYSGTSTDLTTDETADVNDAIKKGYSDFLSAYDWNFLKKFSTISTTAPYDTGTIAVTNGGTTVTLTTGTWPVWAAQGTIYYDGDEYQVSSRTSDTEIELVAAWAETTITAGSYELRRIAYDLPDDFGQPLSWFTYNSQHNRRPIKRISAPDVLALRSGNTTTAYPVYAAIRPKTATFDNSTGQRMEVLFSPLADSAYTFGYSYTILAANSLSSTNPYPIGGQVHAQTILDCCIAAARYLYRDMDLHEYKNQIRDAIAESTAKDGNLDPVYMGFNRDRSDAYHTDWADAEDHYVTVNGILY